MSKILNNLLIKKMVELSKIIQIHKRIFKFKIIAYYVFLVIKYLRFDNYDIISSLVDSGSLSSTLSLSKARTQRNRPVDTLSDPPL